MERSWNSSMITQPNPLKKGVLLDHARQEGLGDHLDARFLAHPRGRSHAVARAPAHRFPEQLRYAARDCGSRKPTRFQHDDLAPPEPGGAQEERRNKRGLPGAGFRRQGEHTVLFQESRYSRQKGNEGQVYSGEVHDGSVRSRQARINSALPGPGTSFRGEARAPSSVPCSAQGARQAAPRARRGAGRSTFRPGRAHARPSRSRLGLPSRS